MQQLPASASRYARSQRREAAAAVAAVSRQWRRMGPDFEASWRSIGPSLLNVVLVAQERVAAGAVEYVPAVLAETGQAAAVEPFATVRPAELVGLAGDGRPVDGLLYGAVVNARQAAAGGATSAAALRGAGQWLSMTVGTLLSDTGRQSESLAIGVRPVGGFVRMLNPPSCSRCVILAGKWYRKNEGFRRHNGCDCRHIPASEAVGRDLTIDPHAYFDSLTPEQQNKTFGKAGAEAIRADANMAQVVNARRGVTTAQVGGRRILATTEGTTRRGIAYREMGGQRARDVRVNGERYRRTRAPRLMPETIQQVATDRADYLRLLARNGYLG